MQRITLDNLKNIDRDCLTAAQVAPVIGADPSMIRWQAHHEREALGFPVIVIGTRIKIPKIPFIKFMLDENTPKQ